MNSSSDRMPQEQVAKLALAICATAESLGYTLSADAAELMADDLAEFPAPTVAAALKACRIELTGKLTTGAIMQRIHAADGRPGKDEAWAIALSANDEFDTVLLTPEIRQAMAASDPVLQAGDKVGARMAFMSAYERHCAFARAEAQPVKWEVSLGYDQARRVTAIEGAVRAKLITQDSANKHLADLRIAPITADGQAIAGLITGQVSTHASAKTKAKLAEVRSIIAESKIRKDREKRKEAQRYRVDIYLRKRQAREAIAKLQERQA